MTVWALLNNHHSGYYLNVSLGWKYPLSFTYVIMYNLLMKLFNRFIYCELFIINKILMNRYNLYMFSFSIYKLLWVNNKSSYCFYHGNSFRKITLKNWLKFLFIWYIYYDSWIISKISPNHWQNIILYNNKHWKKFFCGQIHIFVFSFFQNSLFTPVIWLIMLLVCIICQSLVPSRSSNAMIV